MAKFNFFSILSIISIYCVIKHASSLISEGIANGNFGSQNNFKHQAAILGSPDKDKDLKLLGNGVLVSDIWVLCVAQIFIEDSNIKTLKNYTFKISIGFDYLKRGTAFPGVQNILEIHIIGYNATSYENDIAMSKLEKSIKNIYPVLNAHSIKQPKPKESFEDSLGTVSGFGDLGKKRPANLLLHTLNVKITNSSVCAEDFPNTVVDDAKHFCALPKETSEDITGVCMNDIGAPLVVGNRVAGLVTRAHENCDDREHGALYTNVSAHYDFVHNTILGIKVEGVHVIPIVLLDTPKEDQ